MIGKALKIDSRKFKKTKQFKAKRPSEYWLMFFKKCLLLKQPWEFKWFYLLGLVPVILIIGLFNANFKDQGTIFVIGIFSIIFTIITIGALEKYSYKAFVPVNGFNELAKFIIHVKGDVYRNLLTISVNAGKIEDAKNKLRPEDIGLNNGQGVKYRPYQLERYFSRFTFKDGSICMVSLYQVSLRVTSTKRRSSGKTKTKMKRKHKFFYQLVLKLKESDYSISETFPGKSQYDITVKKESGYNLVKIKYKEKTNVIASETNNKTKHSTSIYTKMLYHLINKKILVAKGNHKLIN